MEEDHEDEHYQEGHDEHHDDEHFDHGGLILSEYRQQDAQFTGCEIEIGIRMNCRAANLS